MGVRRKAFTLLEVMAVISIIGIMMLALIPAYGIARRSSDRRITQAWFQKVILAYESYRQDNSEYPHFNNESVADDLALCMDSFLEILTDGEDQEPYCLLSEADFRATYNGENVPGDGFGNPHTVVLTDDDRDGKIYLNEDSRVPQEFYPEGRNYIYASVAVYSLNDEENPDWEWICSWK